MIGIEKQFKIGSRFVFIDRSHIMKALAIVGLVAMVVTPFAMDWSLNEGGPQQVTLTCQVVDGTGVISCDGAIPEDGGYWVTNRHLQVNRETGDYQFTSSYDQDMVYVPTANITTGPAQTVKFKKRWL